MAELSGNLRQAWRQTNLVQRVILLTVLLACAGAAALLLGWARKPHMGMLYRGLEPEEASAIVEKIRDAGIQYELTAGGTTINVPVEEIYSLRLTMASSGLPTGGAGGQKGYGLVADSPIGASPDTLRHTFIRATEGELAKTIQMLDSVTAVRVHVAVPESKLFLRKGKGASASVALRTKPGWQISPSQAAAIKHMIAGAIQDLTPEKVVVMANGEIVDPTEEGPLGGGSGSILGAKAREEDRLARKVQDMLDVALGPGRSTVKVAVSMDLISSSETTKTPDPETKATTTETIVSESTTPGTDGGGKSKGDSTTKEEITSTNVFGETVLTTTKLPGKVTLLSAAVVVDLSPPPVPETPEGEEPAAAPKGTTLAVADIEEIACNALGLDKDSKTVSVKEAKFAGSTASKIKLPDEGGGFTDPAFLLEMGRRFSLGILVLGALLALRMFRGPKKKGSDLAMTGAHPQLAGHGVGANYLLPGADADADPEILRSQITNALQNNPEEVKKLFLHWVESKQEGV